MYSGTSITSPGGLLAAEILIGGTPQPLYTAPDGYAYVAGEPGHACEVRVRSLAGRIEVALAVDGRDALEDQPETRHDPVGRTTFERDGSPDVLQLGYDTLAALQAMGITSRRPEAFPGRATGYERYQA